MNIQTLINKGIEFLKHPSLHASAGLALVALSQFTAAVPVGDRKPDTYIGFAYALANLVLNKYPAPSA